MLQTEPLPSPLPWGRLAFNALPALAQYYQLNLTGYHGSHRVLLGGYWGAYATYCGSALRSIDFYPGDRKRLRRYPRRAGPRSALNGNGQSFP